jgi:hypothetical protein
LALPIGLTQLPSRAKVPNVCWQKRDLLDTVDSVTPESILRDYALKAATIYRVWMPIEDMPEESLVEEGEPGEEPAWYPWEEYNVRAYFPPVKLVVLPSGRVQIADGNHRTRYFREAGFSHVPCGVIDYRSSLETP